MVHIITNVVTNSDDICYIYILNGKTKIPCPGSATIHDGIMLRFNSDHT